MADFIWFTICEFYLIRLLCMDRHPISYGSNLHYKFSPKGSIILLILTISSESVRVSKDGIRLYIR